MHKTFFFSSIFDGTFVFYFFILFSFHYMSASSISPYDFQNKEEIESVVFNSNDNETDSLVQLLYLQDSSMEVIFQLKYRNNDTKHNRNTLVRHYASQGMTPNILMWNLTWNISFELDELVQTEDDSYWKRDISKSELLHDSNCIPSAWRFLVELGKGLNLFEKSGILVIKDLELLLNVEFGDLVPNAISIHSNPRDVILRRSLCSSAVAAIVPIINTTENPYSGCFFGVTHKFFSRSSVKWFSLLHQSSVFPDKYSICKQSSFAKCSDLSILDFALLKNQLILVTTDGLVVSQNFTEALKNVSGVKTLGFSNVQSVHPVIDEAVKTGNLRRSNIQLFYTPFCYSAFVSDDREQVCMVYYNSTLNGFLSLCSFYPFDTWETQAFDSPATKHTVLSLVNDIQRKRTIVLLKNESKGKSFVQVYKSSNPSFSAFYIDKEDFATDLQFHLYTSTIFAYGSQVWQSLDGGNLFHKVTSLPDQDAVTSLSVDPFGDTYSVTTRLGFIFIGKFGTLRTTVIKYLGNNSLTYPVHSQVVGHSRMVSVVKVQSSGGFLSINHHTIEIKDTDDLKLTVQLSLLVSFRFESQVHFYSKNGRFSVSDVGKMLFSRYGGSALIYHVEETKGLPSKLFKQRIIGHVMQPFMESQEKKADFPLQVTWCGWNASLTLIDEENWQEEDLGKTIVLSQGQSFILIHLLNETTAVGTSYLPWMGDIPLRIDDKGWTMYDFRNHVLENATWWLKEDICRSVIIESKDLSPTFYHLDSMDCLALTATVVSKTVLNTPTPRVLLSNPRLFSVSSVHHRSHLNSTLRVLVSQKPSATGISSLTFTVEDSSLFCRSSSFTTTIHSGCPPSKMLLYIYPLTFTDTTFLDSEAIDSKGIKRNLRLPYNYRPPSARGIAIPMTGNIYNVDQSKPHYRSSYLVTRDTVRYKQCQGAQQRASCGCTRAMRRSSLVRHSDCIDTVYKLLFTERITPKFLVSRDGRESKALNSPFYLEELNHRLDYEVINPSNISVAGVTSHIMEEKMNSSIEFIGSGLYHFRSHVVQENYTFCVLTDEFVVFINETPLPYPVKDIVMACTAMAFSAMLIMIYLWHFHGKKKIKDD